MAKWYSSSVNPEKISLSVKAGGATVVSLLVLFGPVLGLNFVEGDLSQLVAQLSTAVFSLLTAYGLVRKVLASFRNRT